jgi:hypothetical protein
MFMRIAVPAARAHLAARDPPDQRRPVRALRAPVDAPAPAGAPLLEALPHARHLQHGGPFFAMAWAASRCPPPSSRDQRHGAPVGLLVGFVWRGKAITARAVLGLFCGMAGVASIVGLGRGEIGRCQLARRGRVHAERRSATASPAATRSSPSAYRLRQRSRQPLGLRRADPSPHGRCSPLPASWPPSAVAAAWSSACVCSGVAYLLYFPPRRTVGAASALTVGYLIPLFGVTWGWLFLGEPIGWHTIMAPRWCSRDGAGDGHGPTPPPAPAGPARRLDVTVSAARHARRRVRCRPGAARRAGP